MYTIIMNDDKSLVTSVRTTIFQGENLADKIQFLFPEWYEDINLSECVAVLKYIDQGNIFHSENLARDVDLYKGKVRYLLPVDSRLTLFAGNISVKIAFLKMDDNAVVQEVLKTGSVVLTISPDRSVECSADVSEKVAAMQTKLNENTALIEELKATKGDALSYNQENNELHLMANDEPISSVTLEDCDCEDGVPIVDFDNPSDPSEPEVDNVVEF